MNKYVNEMEDYLYNHNYISENNNNIKQKELSVERAMCIIYKYRTLMEEKQKEIEELQVIITKASECIDNFLCTEEYCKLDGESIADNYMELKNILGDDK